MPLCYQSQAKQRDSKVDWHPEKILPLLMEAVTSGTVPLRDVLHPRVQGKESSFPPDP